MKKFKEMFLDKYFNKELDFRVRLFNVLAFSGFIISFLLIISSILVNMWLVIIVGILLMILSWSIMSYAMKTGKYTRCYYISIISIFLFFFPLLFFISGGYHGGMPAVCIFAALFTMLMLDGLKAFLLLGIEMLTYITTTWVCYYYPHLVIELATEKQKLIDIQFAYVSISVLCGIVVFLHIKEYNNQRIQLKENNVVLKQMDEAKSAFLNTVAHELRNPLNIISLHAQDTSELVEEQSIDLEQIKENQKVIYDTIMRLDDILRDLMDTVSIEQGRLQLSKTPIFLAEVIQTAAKPWKRQYEIKHVQTELILELDELSPIFADYARIYQALSNLLSNAFRHTKKGIIVIRLTKVEGGQQICVSDNGEGMDEEMKRKAMEGYVSANKDYWRHGIGLYVCNQIVNAHHGKIWIDSTKNSGTDVFFVIPDKSSGVMSSEEK